MINSLPTEIGVPPGLLLPLPEESTEQFRAENFNHLHLTMEDMVDYGAFIVALLVLDAPRSGRVSMMPTHGDIDQLYEAGYGLQRWRLQQPNVGGIIPFQTALGFYPSGTSPKPPEEIIARYQWIADNAYSPPADRDVSAESIGIMEIVRWAAKRHLAPSPNQIHRQLGGSTLALRKIFDVERKHVGEANKFLRLYRFGARIVAEHKGPISSELMDELYADEFIGKPYETIRNAVDSYTDFWMEFGFLPKTPSLSKQEIVNLGVQRAIRKEKMDLNIPKIEELSAQNRFVSRLPIRKYFKGIAGYTCLVEDDYEVYLQIKEEFVANGVTGDVVQAACRKFDASTDFSLWLKQHENVLVKLSAKSWQANWIMDIVRNGFDLVHDDIFGMQLEDMSHALRQLRISGESARFIFDLIPRIDSDEALTMIAEQSRAA